MPEAVPEDHLLGHRMAVDQDFAQRLAKSSFSSGEWDLIMSVVSFAIEEPGDPAAATLVARADRLDDAVAAADEVPEADHGLAGSPGRGDGAGLVERLRGLLGGSAADDEREADARALIDDYADRLEAHLRERGAWTELCGSVANGED